MRVHTMKNTALKICRWLTVPLFFVQLAGASSPSRDGSGDLDYRSIDIGSVRSDEELAKLLPEYRIRFTGLLSQERELTFEEIVTEYAHQVQTRTIQGLRTDGKTVEIEYTGIPVSDLLGELTPQGDVRNVMVYGSDKYSVAIAATDVMNGDTMIVWKREGEYLIPGEDGIVKIVKDKGLTKNWVKNPVLFDFISVFHDKVPLEDRLNEDEIVFVDQQRLFTLQLGMVPKIAVDEWKLEVGGLVQQPSSYTYAQLIGMPQVTVYATLETISNPPGGRLIGNALWTGVPLSYILEQVVPDRSVMEIVFKCEDGYSTSITLGESRVEGVILAHRLNGETLKPEHGYPVRLVVPDKYGQKWPKWIHTMEFVDYDYRGYWETRGWSDYAGRDRPDQRYD
jgi:DMSO/TMAO reductase YedYZ molybdopterin-dependent catalytic subunit